MNFDIKKTNQGISKFKNILVWRDFEFCDREEIMENISFKENIRDLIKRTDHAFLSNMSINWKSSGNTESANVSF